MVLSRSVIDKGNTFFFKKIIKKSHFPQLFENCKIFI